MLSKSEQAKLEELFQLRREAVQLLWLIVAEWKSDPQSVQCFDLRIVERSIEVSERIRKLDEFRGF